MPTTFSGRRKARGHGLVMLLGVAATVTLAVVPNAPAQPAPTGSEQLLTEHSEELQSEQIDDGVDLIVHVRGESGEPVRGASVWVRTGGSWTEGQSDISGNADFEDLPTGAARVQIVATGWNSSGGSIDLDGGEVEIEVALEPRVAPKTRTPEAEAGKADIGASERPTATHDEASEQ